MVKLTTKNYSYQLSYIYGLRVPAPNMGKLADGREESECTDRISIFTGSNTSRDGTSDRERERHLWSARFSFSTINEDNF